MRDLWLNSAQCWLKSTNTDNAPIDGGDNFGAVIL